MILTLSKMGVAYTALTAAAGVAVVAGIMHVSRDAPAPPQAAVTIPDTTKSVAGAPVREPAPLATGKAQATALANALSGTPLPPERSDGVPTFDVARIEPSGETVVAGRAMPGATIELLRNGEPHASAVADASGQFVMVPKPLPAGTYDLTLRAKQPDGKEAVSKQSVAVVLEPDPKERPVVALMTPDKPTRVLSQPATPKPSTGAVVVEAVETEPGGKLHISGRARAAAAVRLYLNDSFIAAATADADGRFAVTINKGVVAGNYKVRLDEVDSNSGAVRARAEVPFSVPDTVVTGSVIAPAAKKQDVKQDVAAAPQPKPQLAAADGAAPADAPSAASSPSAVVVPKIATSTVSRGDSLWRISRLSYGNGTRYAVIYKANQGQIRNPNLIYPGQVFVIPTQ